MLSSTVLSKQCYCCRCLFQSSNSTGSALTWREVWLPCVTYPYWLTCCPLPDTVQNRYSTYLYYSSTRTAAAGTFLRFFQTIFENTSLWRLKRLVTLSTYRRYTNKCIYLSKTFATCQPSYLYNLLQIHHRLSVLQPRNFSRCHSCPLTLVGAPSATALLRHGIQFLRPLKIVPPYTLSSTTS